MHTAWVRVVDSLLYCVHTPSAPIALHLQLTAWRVHAHPPCACASLASRAASYLSHLPCRLPHSTAQGV